MVTDDFAEAVYQRLLHNIASPGWQTSREVVSPPPPLHPPRAHFNSISHNAVISLHKDLQFKRAAIQR